MVCPLAIFLFDNYDDIGSAPGTAFYAGLFGLGSGSVGGSIDQQSADVFLDGFRFCMFVGIALIIVMLILSTIVNEEKGKAVKGD